MKKIIILGFLFLLIGIYSFQQEDHLSCKEDAAWGFFGHKRINRLAVFTLPQNLFGFYKKNIEYITEHAVDPDKRRYSTKFEAIRHYIDIDHWDTYPFENVPRRYSDAVLKNIRIYQLNTDQDTIAEFFVDEKDWGKDSINIISKNAAPSLVNYRDLQQFFMTNIFGPQRFEDEWKIQSSFYQSALGISLKEQTENIYFEDQFSGYGILPYYLMTMKNKLTNAFKSGNAEKILRISADYGHYIGDAHVPLHTTENYNGQMTNQIGIHGFWESRIPELFADKEWDYLVGASEYIDEPSEFFWDICLASHLLVDSVLTIEKRLSKTFPVDLQNCYTDRNGRNIRTQCEEYSRAFDDEMRGMVEERMQASIKSLGSIWYTCWVDAGRPNLDDLSSDKTAIAQSDSISQSRDIKIKTRNHDY